MKEPKIPISFFLRRLQSLTGFFLILFLFEHFLTNSAASLFFDEGSFFVKTVSIFQSIPYLYVIEIVLIGIPILFHASLGVKYLLSGELNSFKTDGTRPALYEFKRNKAYSWQRITSYILGLLLVFHVVQMRFIDKPKEVILNSETYFFVKIKKDNQLDALANRLNLEVFTSKEAKYLSEEFKEIKLHKNQVLVFSKQSGAAFLLVLRDTFKNPIMVGLYTIFVLAAAFHAFNGLWTFLITWGFIITNRSQRLSLSICYWIMIIAASLGLISIWSSFLY